MAFLKRFFPIVFFCGVFLGVIFFIQPPKSWPDASTFQILIFFIPLLMFFTFTINFFIKYPPKSFALALGVMVIFVLKALGQINLATVFITLAITFLLASSFKRSLTRVPKIPKLKHFGGKR